MVRDCDFSRSLCVCLLTNLEGHAYLAVIGFKSHSKSPM